MRNKTKRILLITVACLAIAGLALSCSSLKELGVKSKVAAEKAAPVAFQLSNLSIIPAEVLARSVVVITARVTNVTDVDGIYNAELKINNVAEAADEVMIPAGETKNLFFSVSRDTTGTYQVALGELAGEFVVAERTATQSSNAASVGFQSTNSGCCGSSGSCSCGATNSSSSLPQQSTSCGCGR
jgi:hypothetical protein